MFLARWRAKRANRVLIDQIHGEIVAAARDPALFADLRVPDDLDGRFAMMTLHAGLVLRRLTRLGAEAADLNQELVDRIFTGFDDALRELAIADAGVVKRMKKMVEAFYGRNKAFGEALDAADETALAAALARNAYRDGAIAAEHSPQLARRVLQMALALDALPYEAFARGLFRFPNPVGAHG